GREHLHDRMGVGNPTAALEGVGGSAVVLQLGVVYKSELVVKLPVIGVGGNTLLHHGDGFLGHAGTVGRVRGQKVGTKLVGHHQMGIESGGYFQQGRQQSI